MAFSLTDALLLHSGHPLDSTTHGEYVSPVFSQVLHEFRRGRAPFEAVRLAFGDVLRIYWALSSLHVDSGGEPGHPPVDRETERAVAIAAFGMISGLMETAQRLERTGDSSDAVELRELAAGVSMLGYCLVSGGYEELGPSVFYHARAVGFPALADAVLRSLPERERKSITEGLDVGPRGSR